MFARIRVLVDTLPPHLAWLHRDQRAEPLLFLIGIGAGSAAWSTTTAPAQIAGVSYAAFFAPGMLAAAAMQNAFLEGAAGRPCCRLRGVPQRHARRR